MTKKRGMNRRELLKGVAAGSLATMVPWSARAQVPNDPRFLIVLTGSGGASIIDSMLAIKASESANASIINTFPDGLVQDIDNTPFRAIDRRVNGIGPLPYSGDTNQSNFVRRHAQDMMVVTHTGTSVNHLVAQKRALTGNDAWAGRTLQEIIAETYGQSFPIPNVNMGAGGYIEPGVDPSISTRSRGQIVTDARLFFAGLDGSRGIPKAPPKSVLQLARTLRDTRLDEDSIFGRTFGDSKAIRLWKEQRAQITAIEQANLITNLNVLAESPGVPLQQYGLPSSPDLARLRAVFPSLDGDPLQAQGALAYLLIKNKVSTSVTLGPGLSPLVGLTQIVDSPPLAFDFSHSSHRDTQAVMWSRLLNVADRLIGLLASEDFGDGGSFWDRSLLYVATDFGRSKNRVANSTNFGSGHHLNNGSLIVSPMCNGGRVLGGVDADTALTYGFNPQSGQPDQNRHMTEPEIFSGILQAMGVDTSPASLPDMPAMRRA